MNGHGVGRDQSGTEAACAEAEGRKTGAALGLPSSGFGSGGSGNKQGLYGGFGGALALSSASGMTKPEGNLCEVSGVA
ncbi:hypothetical protein [Chlorobium limicola]